jgi:hypothetical protein
MPVDMRRVRVELVAVVFALLLVVSVVVGMLLAWLWERATSTGDLWTMDLDVSPVLLLVALVALVAGELVERSKR